MTFAQILTRIKSYSLLSSSDADTRLGIAINAHYRRITSQVGLDASRFVTRSASTSNGVQTVTFTEIEKIDRIIDATDSNAIRLLTETSIHEIRSNQPGTGDPTRWATKNTDADSVTVLLDTLPQTTYTLQADGWTTLSDLSGSDEPIFPESFHDILVWSVLADELLKKEKDKLAREYERKAEKLLADLRFYLADSPTYSTRQGGGSVSGATGGGGGGGNVGGSAYTQTGLITFDRDPSAPFAVTDTSAYVPNLFVEGVGNVTTDRLIGRDTTGTGESEQLTVGNGLEFTGSGGIGIANDAITNARLANVATATFKGRTTAGTGDPEDLTATQATALLNTFVGDSGSGGTKGLVPAPATGDATKVLRGDATWVAPPAGGSDTQVQFNDGGTALGGDAGLTYNKTSDTLTLAGPLNIAGASAGQIVFPGTQNASSNANTFDDYEEGTWTPGLRFGGGNTGMTGTFTGSYVKFGQVVFIQGNIVLTAKGSSTGVATIVGQPFTTHGSYAAVLACSAANMGGTLVGNIDVVVNEGSTTMNLWRSTSTGRAALDDTNCTNTSTFYFSGMYRADA